MGGTSTSQQQTTSQTTPWATAQPALTGILNGVNSLVPNAGLNTLQSGAINQLVGNAQQGNPYASAIGGGATGLLNGGGANANNAAITNNLTNYQGLLTPYASGAMIGNNTALQNQLSTIDNDVTNQVSSQFAAAGRPLGTNAASVQALGRGIAQGEAPVIANQYNQDVQNQIGAANSLYGAGNSTYGLLNQNQSAANQNYLSGIGAASSALSANNYAPNAILNAEQQAFNIPASQYQTLLGMVLPSAQAFGKQNGTQTGSQTESGAQQFAQIAGGIGAIGGLLKNLPSDRRLKENIQQVGVLYDGSPVYRYRYKNSPAFQIGLMAQDVERETPEAVVEIDGFKAVDYRKATERAARIGEAG